jgi:phage terminase large subunit GpA-like protein
VTRFSKGSSRREWVKIRSRNEALDCNVYALAALKLLSPDLEALSQGMLFVPRAQAESNPAPAAPTTATPQTVQQAWIPKLDNWLNR